MSNNQIKKGYCSGSQGRFFTMIFVSGLLMMAPFCLQSQNNKQVLSNKNIIDLQAAGISGDAIKNVIASSTCNFETHKQALGKLKKAGIGDEVITSMIEKMANAGVKENVKSNIAKPAAETAAITSGINSALVAKLKKEGSGIYFKAGSDIGELEPTVYSQMKKSGELFKNLLGGIPRSTSKMSLSGGSANKQLDSVKPVFYFVFNVSGDDNTINEQTPLWFTSASSPNEFMMVKFLTGKNNKVRDVIVGSANDYTGTASGVDEKQKVSFKYNKLEKGIYEIYFEDGRLAPGEYCFMYAGSMSVNGVTNPKVYDFGIK